MDEGITGEEETMSMVAAAARVGVDEQTVRRWFDEASAAGEPVGERERDALGVLVPGSHRRPYRRAVEDWRRRRKGVNLPVPVPVSPAAPGG